MNPLPALRSRLAERSDSEHEQALLRIVIVALFLGYMAAFHGWPADWTSQNFEIVAILAGFLAIATALFAAIVVAPAPNVARRLIGMLADCGGCTWYMSVAGDYGFSVIGVYLFITFGNGFRYGRRYLFGCQILCLVGLTGVLLMTPYWQQRQIPGVGLLIALVVLPLYVSTLLKRIQEARARAEEANVAKTSFLANMSHEMRTPLNGIVGVVDLLRTTALTSRQGELVGLLRHSISVLRSLVDDVLDITKIEAGRVTIEVVPFDLHACINGLTQLLRPHALSKGLTLTAVVDPALEYRLKGDPHHLRQILLNLMGNAIKFTERGAVGLAVSLKQETDVAVTARFEVKDTGIGISPEALPRIFERFVQADQSTTRKYGGTGLGTTIAKQLVELMGGNIGVESVLGQGSTFWIELPLLRDVARDEIERTRVDVQTLEGDTVCLVIAAPGYDDVTATLRSLGERYEIVAPANALGVRIDQLRLAGVTVRAVIAACPVDQACTAFNVTAQRLPDAHTALIYVANGPVSVVDRARVNSISGAQALESASPRLVANAIHAVTAGADGGIRSGADLSMILKRERAALKVMVAEDNATNQKIIRQLLESAGHEVILASDGEEALDLYESEKPDLAILDFNMPQRSGIEVIQAIRMMEPPGVRMPAMILSASVTVEARERAAKAGADEFVGKPFEAGALIMQIDRLSKRVTRVKDAQATPSGSAQRLTIVRNEATAATPPTPRPYAAEKASDAGLVDAARLMQLEDIARDPAFLAELVGGFISDVEMILSRTARAVSDGDDTAIADLMHSLKGAAVGLGATRLAALADNLDQAPPGAPVSESQIRLEEIAACAAATFAHLKQYLQSQHQH